MALKAARSGHSGRPLDFWRVLREGAREPVDQCARPFVSGLSFDMLLPSSGCENGFPRNRGNAPHPHQAHPCLAIPSIEGKVSELFRRTGLVHRARRRLPAAGERYRCPLPSLPSRGRIGRLSKRSGWHSGSARRGLMALCSQHGKRSHGSRTRSARNFRRLRGISRLPHVTLHALRRIHASQLITSGMDMLTVSRRTGHSSPAITRTVYGHLLSREDRAAEIMERHLPGLAWKGSKRVADGISFPLRFRGNALLI